MTASEFDRFFEDALYDEFITSEHEGTVNSYERMANWVENNLGVEYKNQGREPKFHKNLEQDFRT
ncbi:unnamed protein product [Oikopleura dioica]|uniref:Uncharacterized protein n=1 Tax=Oikopleura dioica TaxID=34765 RepID=E4YNZ5_OIKDI|nr:unnamed protein product [Oikopleura dioica]